MNENVLTKVLKYICAAIATTAFFVNCGKLIKAEDVIKMNESNNESIVDKNVQSKKGEEGEGIEYADDIVVGGYGSYGSNDGEDYENNFEVTDEQTSLQKSEVTGLEVGRAWYEHLFSTSYVNPQVMEKGYNEKVYQEVEKKQIYTKNLNKIVGYWTDCDGLDIGAVLKRQEIEYVDTYELTDDFYRIPGFTILDDKTTKIPVTESTGAAMGAEKGGEEKEIIEFEEIEVPDEVVLTKIRKPTRIKRYKNEYEKYVENIETWLENSETYYLDEEERYVWKPKDAEYLDVLEEVAKVYGHSDIEVMSTTLYKDSVVTKIVVGEVLRKTYLPGTQSWQVYKLNEETGLWDYVDTYKSKRADGNIDIYFGEAGKYLIYQYQNVKKTVCKRYHYTTKKTLVLDDLNMILGESMETGSFVTDEVNTLELEERQRFIQPITESGLWMISADGVSTSAVIRRTE